MITGEGGFVHRTMPPVGWDHGEIPIECYSPGLNRQQIQDMLLAGYLEPERVRRLADSDDEHELWRTRMAIELVAEIDADTIFVFNQTNVPARN